MEKMNEEIIILGLDIGGVNTKAALIKINHNDEIIESFSYIEYFPFWEKALNDIPEMFQGIIKNIIIKNNYSLKDIKKYSITITAELSDAFQTKREGIITILNALEKVFEKEKLFFINNSGKFNDFDTTKKDFLKISAANWISTSLFLGKFIPKCIMIDSGSTTIDIIPILNSKPVTKGNNDITRLLNHELVYTGGLRATIPSITHFVPYNGEMVRISFEKFALVSDVHRILNNFPEQEYLNDTADGRSKSLEDCYSRLARIICMDIETISIEELNIIANYIYDKQLEIISREIELFFKQLIKRYPEFKSNPLFVITGQSSNFLIMKTLKKLGYSNIKTYEAITNIPDQITSSAFAVAGALHFQFK